MFLFNIILFSMIPAYDFYQRYSDATLQSRTMNFSTIFVFNITCGNKYFEVSNFCYMYQAIC